MQGDNSENRSYVPMFNGLFSSLKRPIVYAAVVFSGLMGSQSVYSDSRLNPCRNQDLAGYMQARTDCLDIVYSSTDGSREEKAAGVNRFVSAIGQAGNLNETVSRGSDIIFQIRSPEGTYSLTLQRDAGLSLEKQIEFLNSLCERRHQQAVQSDSRSDNSGLRRAYEEEKNLDGVDADREGGSEFAGTLVGGGASRAIRGRFGHDCRGGNGRGNGGNNGGGGSGSQYFQRGGTGTNPPGTHPGNGGSIR